MSEPKSIGEILADYFTNSQENDTSHLAKQILKNIKLVNL
jgi:hypothetical protein